MPVLSDVRRGAGPVARLYRGTSLLWNSFSPIKAVGGDSVFDLNGYRVHVFNSSQDLTILDGGTGAELEYVVVAGGGAGKNNGTTTASGGGGAGGLVTDTAVVTPGTLPIVVGAGGAESNGTDSTLLDVVAVGGGLGGLRYFGGISGGSGGGAGSSSGALMLGGAGILGQGNDGGNGNNGTGRGAGGGGAGQRGGDTSSDLSGGGGPGGDGIDLSAMYGTGIGVSGWVAAGGGGGTTQIVSAPGGQGGGGAGGTANGAVPGQPGVYGTGSGGGGASGAAGTGGSGIVLVRYKYPLELPLTIPWHTALWADDIVGVNDGQEVTAWYDSTGSGRVTVPTGNGAQPNMGFYVESDAKFNGHASVQFIGNSGAKLALGEELGSNRESFLVVAYDEVITGNQYIVEGGSGTSNRNFFATIGLLFSMYIGGNITYHGNGDTLAHAASWSSTNRRLDGSVQTVSHVGSTQNQITLGTYISLNSQYNAKARIAFYGIIDRNLTTEERNALHQWAIDYYGTPAV